MKRILALIVLFSTAYCANAQLVTKISLSEWKGKEESVPFAISAVNDNRANPTIIGNAALAKKRKTRIEFRSSSEEMIEKFVVKNFSQGSDMEIQMDIEVLEIKNAIIKGKEVPSLFFSCKFYKQSDLQQHLYVFNARNAIPKKKSLKVAMTNYVSRALTAAILNFKKASLQHPEWKKSNPNTPNVNVKSIIKYNQFESLGDTIALDGQYKLQEADFGGTVSAEEKDDAYSYFMLSYTLDAVDSKNEILINIHPKAFFLRSRSWAKMKDSSDWRAYQQLLFDLASYHGRLLKNTLQKHEYTAGFYKTEANQIYNEISADYFDEMDQLQAETLYGAYKNNIKKWRTKVDQYLSDTSD